MISVNEIYAVRKNKKIPQKPNTPHAVDAGSKNAHMGSETVRNFYFKRVKVSSRGLRFFSRTGYSSAG